MEFCNRYYEFCKGNKDQLQTAGQLIALILVVWAASFGVNEFGVEELYDNQGNPRRRRDRINEMVQEVLFLIDIHGILRKPSWDGVRALLLILPLTQGAYLAEVCGTGTDMAISRGPISHGTTGKRIFGKLMSTIVVDGVLSGHV